MACPTYLPSPSLFLSATGTRWSWYAKTCARLLRPLWGVCLTPLQRFSGLPVRSLLKDRPRCGSSNSPAARRLTEPYPFPFIGSELDFRPLLQAVALDRVRGRDIREIARSFQLGIAQGLCDALNVISRSHGLDTVVLSGGVFQNELLLEDLKSMLTKEKDRCKSGRIMQSRPTTEASAWARQPWRRSVSSTPFSNPAST